MISVHCNLCLLGSSYSLSLASQVAGMTGVSQLIFVIFSRDGFCYIVQSGLTLLTSGDLSASTSQSARITGMSHQTQQDYCIKMYLQHVSLGRLVLR